MFVAYAPLEENLTAAVGVTIPTFEGASPTLSTTTSLITIIFFMLIGGAAFYRYVMAGIYRLEASENGVRRSNEAFKGATFGVLGVFLMFLIFFTFNRDILLSDVGLGALRSKPVAAGGGGAAPVTPGGQAPTTPAGPLPTGACKRSTCTAADLPRVTGSNDQSIRSELSSAGVSVNVGACSSIGQTGCTNVGGMPSDVVSMLKSLKSACNCSVTVSGGTEWWSHSSHGPGVFAVDLRIPQSGGVPNLNDPLYVFLKSQTSLGSSSLCHTTVSWSGWKFCDEKSGATVNSTNRHWHVSK